MSFLFTQAMRKAVLFTFVVMVLTACGGGGGGQDEKKPTGPLLSFLPKVLLANVKSGTSAVIAVESVTNHFQVVYDAPAIHASIVDKTGVLLPKIRYTQNGGIINALLETSPSLPSGAYKGSFTVNVCADIACTKHLTGSPMQLPYEITVTPSPIEVKVSGNLINTANLGGTLPAPSVIDIATPNANWTASASDPWIKLAGTSGKDSGQLTVSYEVAGLVAGKYDGTINLESSDGQKRAIPVSLTLIPRAFVIQNGEILMSAINGAPIAPRGISFTLAGDSDTWNASTEIPWMTVTPAQGSTPGQTVIHVDPAIGKLASGNHSNMLLLSAATAYPVKVPVKLTLAKATLSASETTLVLGGIHGRDELPNSMTINLNTGTNTHPWKLTGLPAWVKVNAIGGTVSQAGTVLTFTPILANAPYGNTSAAITLTATVNGDTLSIPINLAINRDQRKLLFSEVGVALASTPGWSRLTRTITVKDNYALNANWTVSSSQPWLSAVRSGSKVILTADPTQLPVDTTSYASVTLGGVGGDIAIPEVVQIGLWKGSVTPSAPTKLAVEYLNIKADPIRPLAYVNAGMSAIDVYNVYTGQQVATIADVGAAVSSMSISPNGDFLYTYDTANRNIVVVDLKTMAKMGTWSIGLPVNYSSTLLAIRPNGVNIILAADGAAYLASTGRVIGTPGTSDPLSATSDSSQVYTAGGGYAMDYSEIGGGTLFSHLVNGPSGDDVAVNPAGTRAYSAKGGELQCMAYATFDGVPLGNLPGGGAHTTNVDVGSDGRIYCGILGWYMDSDIWVYEPNGAILKSFKFATYAKSVLYRQMSISGDGLVLTALTDDPFLVFAPVGP